MNFNTGNRIRIIYKSECSYGEIDTNDFIFELIFPLQQPPIDVLKEDDHAGQTYNPYNDTWSWL